MPKIIRFHLDENVSHAIAEGLRRRGIDVTTTPEAGMIGLSDEEQIAFAATQERVIFTQDTDFLRMARTGISHNGIIYCQQKSRSIGDIVRGIVLIWEYLEPEEMKNKVEFI
jgi:predicted nuclease of predicted toxin-antitoxin system